MNIDSIKNGIVLDHIKAGKSMEIYKFLNLGELDCSVAIIKNVNSRLMGKKDIIKIENLCRDFVVGSETVHALRDVSFAIQPGEFVTIMGTSGSGKSTLLNVLGCLDIPTCGE